MPIKWADRAWDDYLWWQQNDKAKVRRINELIRDIQRNPFEGLGKPEPLKHALSGWWSRRIDGEHRLVYRIGDGAEGTVEIAQARYHY